MIRPSAVFYALAAMSIVSAQSGLSSNCQSALEGIAVDADAAGCLATSSLLPLFIGNGSNILGTIDNWVTNMCASPACSNNTLEAVVNNVTSGCSQELSFLNISSSDQSSIVSGVQAGYPTARKIVCLKDGNNNCLTQTLTNLQSFAGNLSLSDIMAMAMNPSASIPSNITCTDCVKAAYNVINSDQPGLLPSEVNSTLQQECGASFIDGSSPSGISEAASSSSQGSSAVSHSTGASILISAGSALTALAVLL